MCSACVSRASRLVRTPWDHAVGRDDEGDLRITALAEIGHAECRLTAAVRPAHDIVELRMRLDRQLSPIALDPAGRRKPPAEHSNFANVRFVHWILAFAR